MDIEYPAGATPLDPNEIDQLIPTHIMTQQKLNEWEAVNILKAENWLFSRNHRHYLDISFIKKLHKKMFGDTWKWAGEFRKTERNIGIAPFQITTQLQMLLDDVRFQIENKSFPIDEIAYRFHHRLVAIHPFPNGNGRHARLITDYLLRQQGEERFTWGSQALEAPGPTRRKYIHSLKAADQHDYTLLAAFVRS